MSFVWNTVVVGTKIKNADIVQVKDNIDHLETHVGSSYSWSQIPPGVSSKIERADALELRNALDDAYDKNVCSANNASHNSTVLAGQDTTVDATHNHTVLAGQDTTVDATHNHTVLAGQDTTVDATHNHTVLSGQDVTADSTQNNSALSGQDTSINSTADGSRFVSNFVDCTSQG